jgi:hypothetical protein
VKGGLIRSFIHFVHDHKEIGNPIGDDWVNVTVDEFEHFRANLDYTRRFGTLSNLPSISPTSSSNCSITSAFTPVPAPAPSPPSSSPVEMFKRGIKLDPSAYPTLKDELWNDNWHHSFANLARAQDVHDVLDDKYVPITAAEKDQFQEKQKVLYAILDSKVETEKGRAIIR